ncbi:hypothetical protein J19TS2_10930 [Cohnella xylanilytica]|uniref:DNA mismatch repair endonuclease MutL n=1 Tax=Cohnella xylanilytica TaxID=557555 RepID=UPI001B2A7A50|nr:DNA mismatch repair endonuclease MutL [Cohnella xylanilytica]GIO11538.1 hypothetical protein J19TS2_10930 [Cohnella xylanilytica]
MGVIRLLDEHLANQIAAGEVVERPASVLKELIENAVDAGATTIDVTAEDGGLSSLRIVDNGSGIQPDDLRTAFQRHATSKIATGKDLFQIVTLGFRGEALPSIAAVAKVRCISASDTGGLGRLIEIEGGQIKREEDAGAPRGTDMTVKELFYNTPARLKYMRTVQTELGHLSDVVYRQALSRPDIAFTFAHNGTTLLRTQGNGDLRQVVAAIYGTAAAKAMIEVSAEHPDYAIEGLTALPVETRSNRNAVTVLVNGRYVRSPAVVQPLLQAYHTLLPINRYPLSVLSLRMHPSLVDVNVHPAKLEVRFSKETELRAFVEGAVRKALGGQAYIPSGSAVRAPKAQSWVQEQIRFQMPPVSAAEPAPGSASEPGTSAKTAAAASSGSIAAEGGVPRVRPQDGAPAAETVRAPGAVPQEAPSFDEAAAAYEAAAFDSLIRESAGAGYRTDEGSGRPRTEGEDPFAGASSGSGLGERAGYGRPGPQAESGAGAYSRPARSGPSAGGGSYPAGKSSASPGAAGSSSSAAGRDWPPQRPVPPGARIPEKVWQAAYAAPENAAEPAGFPELHWIGQLHGTYLVAQNETGLFLIDQHAAHERIHYEYYFDKFGRPEEASQELLLPVTLSFSPDECVALRDRLPLFEQVGVYLEDFGGNTFIVRAVPHWLPKGEEADIVREMAEWVLAEKGVDLRKVREKASILCSCKASIKANQSLTREAGETLLRRLSQCRQPYTCPHGRPIVVSFTTYELEKMFKRVMN